MFLSGFQQFPSIRFIVILSKLAANKTHTHTLSPRFSKNQILLIVLLDFFEHISSLFKIVLLYCVPKSSKNRQTKEKSVTNAELTTSFLKFNNFNLSKNYFQSFQFTVILKLLFLLSNNKLSYKQKRLVRLLFNL